VPGVEGRVVVVTGSGGGLGRQHALLFAQRGAKVVINDLGGSRDGTGAGSEMADNVVNEIKAAGGEAVANYDNVATPDGGKAIVQSAVDAFGRVDIVVNNAGILRDVTFHKMDDQQWDAVLKVHLYGTYYVTRAAWPLMREQSYGRVVVTTSTSGLYGRLKRRKIR
jgi:NAD(P)-dependent dehydrogenase (short-subunit alcohol dehydrogenase family)